MKIFCFFLYFIIKGVYGQAEITQIDVEISKDGVPVATASLTADATSKSIDKFEQNVLYDVSFTANSQVDQWFYLYDEELQREIRDGTFPLSFVEKTKTVLKLIAQNSDSQLTGIINLSVLSPEPSKGYGQVFYVLNDGPVIAQQIINFMAIWASDIRKEKTTNVWMSLTTDEDIVSIRDDGRVYCEYFKIDLNDIIKDWYANGSILQVEHNNPSTENFKYLCTKIFERSFESEGRFSLTAFSSYKGELLSTTGYTCVTRTSKCPAPTAQIRIDENKRKIHPTVGDSPLITYTTNDVINLWGKVERADCLLSDVEVSWKFFDMPENASILYQPIHTDIIENLTFSILNNGILNPIKEQISITLQPGDLQIGSYLVLFTFVEENYCGDDSYFPTDGIRLNIIEPPLTVIIDRGEYIEWPIKSNQSGLELKAVISRSNDITVTWFCHFKNQETEFFKYFEAIIQGQEYDGLESPGCFKTGFSINQFSTANNSITIPNSQLNYKTFYYIFTIFVVSTSSNENSNSNQTVKVYTPPEDQVNVISISTECISNCDHKLTKQLQLEGSCVFGCSDLQINSQQVLIWRWLLVSPDSNKQEELQSNTGNEFESNVLEISLNNLNTAGRYSILFEVLLQQLESKSQQVLATSRYGLTISPGPMVGSCTIRPNIGEALTTQFKFECQGFNNDPNSSPQYRIEESPAKISQINNEKILPTIIYQGPESKIDEVYLPVGKKENGYRVKLRFIVTNTQGTPSITTVYVIVKPPQNIENLTVESFVKGRNSKLNRLIRNGNIDSAIQLTTTLTSILKQQKNTKDQIINKVNDATSLLEALNSIKIANLQKAVQISTATIQITDLFQPKLVKLNGNQVQELYNNSLNVFGTVSEYLKTVDKNSNKKTVYESVNSVLNVASNLAQIVDQNSTESYLKQENLLSKKQEIIKVLYDQYTTLSKPVELTASENEVIMLSSSGNIGINGQNGGLYTGKTDSIDPVSVSTLYYNPMLQKDPINPINLPVIGISSLNESKLKQSSRSIEYYDVLIPTRQNKTSKDLVSDATGIQRILLPTPCGFSIGKNTSHIATSDYECGAAVVQFNLGTTSKYNRRKRQVTSNNGLDIIAYIVLKPNKPCRLPNQPCLKASFITTLDTEPCNNSTDDDALCSKSNNTLLTIELPLMSSNDINDGLKDNLWSIPVTEELEQNLGLNKNNNDDVILVVEDLQPDVLAMERERNDTQSYQQVSVNVVKADCLTWNYEQKDWDPQLCSEGRLLEGDKLHCRCVSKQDKSKLPLLVAASFIIVPNKINVEDLSDLLRRLHNNPYVILTNCLWILVFLPFFIWARRKDASDKKDSHIFIPEDSNTLCEFFYEVVIFTGILNNSGTTANVTLVLQDSLGTKTEPHVINDDTAKTLNRGGVDTFLIPSKVVLKDVDKVLIWHDNTGDRPSWYLERIAVNDLQNIDVKVPSCFFVSKWLSLDIYPFTCKQELHKATEQELLSFENAFKIYFQNLFKEANVWTAPLHRTPCSTYTRVQRIACVMVAVFGCMVASIMFYDTSNKDTYSVAMGYVNIDFSAFVSSTEAAILLMPVNFLITFIFRNLKPPKHETEEKSKEETSDNNSNNNINSKHFKGETSKKYQIFNDNIDTVSFDDITMPQIKKVPHPSTMNRESNTKPSLKTTTTTKKFKKYLDQKDFNTLHGVVLSQKERKFGKQVISSDDVDVTLATDNTWNEATSSTSSHLLVTMKSIRSLAEKCSTSTLKSTEATFSNNNNKNLNVYATEKKYELEDASFLDDSFSVTSNEDFLVEEGYEVTKVSDHLFSRKFSKVAWLLVFLHLIACSAVTILYGLQYGSDKFFQWLFSFLLSILQNLFIVSPIRITLTAAILATAKGVYTHQWAGFIGNHARLDVLNRWRELQSQNYEDNRDRVKRVVGARYWCYEIPEFDRLARAGHLKITIAHVKRYWRETVCWIIMTLFVTSLVVIQRDPRVFRLDQRVREYFVDDFYEISRADDVYDFLETLTPTLYNDNEEYKEDEFKLLGPIRIRQVRLNPTQCRNGSFNSTFRSKCKIPDKYVNQLSYYDTGSYIQSWKTDPNLSGDEIPEIFGKDLWQYSRVDTFYSTKIVFGNNLIRPTYPIGGYVADLGYSTDDILPVLRGMKNTGWLDYQSAAVFIEFSLFTPSFRHVSSVVLGVEFLARGGVNLCLEIYHYRPIYFYQFSDLILSLCQIFHVLVNCLILVEMLLQCKKDHWRKERCLEVVFDIWNFICLITIFLTTFAYFLYLQHLVSALEVSGMFRLDPGRFVPFGTPAYYQRFYSVVLAFAAFFSYVRILKVFLGSRIVSLMIQTLYLAQKEVASLSIIFAIFLVCFSHVGVIAFGPEKFAFNNFWFASVSLFQLAGGMDVEHPDTVTSEVWWSIYFLVFMTLVLIIFVNFFAVVLSDAHNNMKDTRFGEYKHPVETLAVAWLYEKILLFCGYSSKHFREKYAKVHLQTASKSNIETIITPTEAKVNTAQKPPSPDRKSSLRKTKTPDLVTKSVHFQSNTVKQYRPGSKAKSRAEKSKLDENKARKVDSKKASSGSKKAHNRVPLLLDIRKLLVKYSR